MRRKGFTLIELMIVIAIIAIIAAIAIPGLLSSRLGANETNAIGSLKAISTGQEQFRSQNKVDENNNGAGEYGFLVELSGNHLLRNSTGDDVAAVNSPYIPSIFENDTTVKSGYSIVTYLVSDSTGADYAWAAAWVDCDDGADVNETEYGVIAYPTAVGKTGNRIFIMNAQGTIMQHGNNIPESGFDGTNVPDELVIYSDAGTATFPGNGDASEADAAILWTAVGG